MTIFGCMIDLLTPPTNKTKQKLSLKHNLCKSMAHPPCGDSDKGEIDGHFLKMANGKSEHHMLVIRSLLSVNLLQTWKLL